MSAAHMNKSPFSTWEPAVDVYELNNEYIVFMDVSGVDPDELSVVAESRKLHISGTRKSQLEGITCIHQLEIEYGPFERSIVLPHAIDVSKTSSSCKNGFLMVRMPALQDHGRVDIKVT